MRELWLRSFGRVRVALRSPSRAGVVAYPRRVVLVVSGVAFACLVLPLLGPALAQAPSFDGATTGSTPGFKYYIWGEVRSPGVKTLGPQAEITELLSAAGGPAPDADMTRVELIRGVDRQVERFNLRTKLESGEGVTLSPGDIVVIPRNFWPKFREGLTLVSGLATILNLALTIARIYN